jgi:hypothetical protein
MSAPTGGGGATWQSNGSGYHGQNAGTFEVIGEMGVEIWAGPADALPPTGIGGMSIDINPLFGLILSYQIPALPLAPKISLDTFGIMLKCGPPVMPSISLGPTGIELTVAEVYKISMGPTGITLSAGPAASISISPDGIEINGAKLGLTGFTGIDMNGLKIGMTCSTVAVTASNLIVS